MFTSVFEDILHSEKLIVSKRSLAEEYKFRLIMKDQNLSKLKFRHFYFLSNNSICFVSMNKF